LVRALKLRLLLRNEREGAMRLAVIALLLIVLLVGSFALYAVLSDPTRAMNDCGGKAVSYARGSGTFHLWSVLGAVGGQFDTVNVDVTTTPSPGSGVDPWAPWGSLFGIKGDAWVETTVTGPGGVSVAKWKSARTAYDFSLIDQAHGQPYAGSFVGGLACFEQAGVSTWHFELFFETGSGEWFLASTDRTVDV